MNKIQAGKKSIFERKYKPDSPIIEVDSPDPLEKKSKFL